MRILLALLLIAAPPVAAQQHRQPLAGVVTADGAPVAGANVFLLETLEGATSDSAGRFRFSTAGAAPLTLVVRRLGYQEQRLVLDSVPAGQLDVELRRARIALDRVHVVAGRYTASEERGSTLTPLEVATTPGTTAEVFRAIETLPGAQMADEGTALFVQGGDYTETKVLIDGAELLSPVRLQRPTGTFIGSVDPFLLEGIVFSTAGFGARHGNALSAVADLRTSGPPLRSSATVGAGLSAVSFSAAQTLPGRNGARVAFNRFDLEPMLRVNGIRGRYSPAPTGYDLSASLHHEYSAAGRVKVFAIRQTNRFGIGVADAAESGTFSTDGTSGLVVLSWRDVRARLAPSATLSRSFHASDDAFGSFELRTRYAVTRAAGAVDVQLGEPLLVRAGAELDRYTAGLLGLLASAHAGTDDPRERVIDQSVLLDKLGAFAEAEWRALPRLGIVTGLRADHASIGEHRSSTVDPRLSASLAITSRITATAAAGTYRQMPDLLLYAPPLGDPGLPPMRATQLVAGAQLAAATGTPVARVELYRKSYDDLAQMRRDYSVVPGGVGTAHGLDAFVRGGVAWGVTGRLTYSALRARRTDPNSGEYARAPFDVTHSLTAIAERAWPHGWRTGASWRAATGRPETPIIGADERVAEDGERHWVPRYGAPFSERLPAFGRVDLSASHIRALGDGLQLVGYAAVTNLLDRRNVYAWRYTTDYAAREPVRSIFSRSIYFGASLTRSRTR